MHKIIVSFLVIATVATYAAPGPGGPVVLMGIDAEDGGEGGHGPISVYANVAMSILNASSGGAGILVIGGGKSPTDDVTEFWNRLGTATATAVTYVNGASAIQAVAFDPFKMIAVVSDRTNTPEGGLTQEENDALALRAVDIATFINEGRGLLGLGSVFRTGAGPYAYLAGLSGGVTVGFPPEWENIDSTPEGLAIGITDALDICCWHNTFVRYPAFLHPLAYIAASTNVCALGGTNIVVPTGVTCPDSLVECSGSPSTFSIPVTVTDPEGDALTVVWHVNGVPVHTNTFPSSAPATNVIHTEFSYAFAAGTNIVLITADDGDPASPSGQCRTQITLLPDATPPDILCPPDQMATSAIVHYDVTATDICSTAVTILCNPPSGTIFPAGVTTVNCSAMDEAGNINICSFTVTVEDSEPPMVGCRPAANPASKHIPNSGRNGKSGMNPDGFYELVCSDNCDESPNIYIRDGRSNFIAGPFQAGQKIKVIQAPGSAPAQQPGPGGIIWIKLNGDALLYAVDAAGNASEASDCMVSPRPK